MAAAPFSARVKLRVLRVSAKPCFSAVAPLVGVNPVAETQRGGRLVVLLQLDKKAIIHFMNFIPSMIAKQHLLSLPIKIVITLTLKGETN